MQSKIRILHVINSFEFGGAEAMLCNLLLRADQSRFESSVVSLIDDLTVAGPIQNAGIPITVMGMRPGIPDPRGVARLRSHIKKQCPDVVQTWMDHSNLIGAIASRWAGNAKVVWGIHHSNHVAGLTKRTTLLTVGLCARLSDRLPARIVYCSEHARNLYENRGFSQRRGIVIPNGFNTGSFKSDSIAREEIRREIGVNDETPLIGLAARFDPLKDHSTFIRAGAEVIQRFPAARLLMCGDKIDRNNESLMAEINSAQIADKCILLGPRRDIPRIQAAIDVAVSSSISEAFPLVVGEAMSCGTPCAVTDVGDSALIVGDTGRVVPPSNPKLLGAAICDLLSLDKTAKAQLGNRARQRVLELFDLTSVTRRYESLYTDLWNQPERSEKSQNIELKSAARAVSH